MRVSTCMTNGYASPMAHMAGWTCETAGGAATARTHAACVPQCQRGACKHTFHSTPRRAPGSRHIGISRRTVEAEARVRAHHDDVAAAEQQRRRRHRLCAAADQEHGVAADTQGHDRLPQVLLYIVLVAVQGVPRPVVVHDRSVWVESRHTPRTAAPGIAWGTPLAACAAAACWGACGGD